MTLPLHVDGVPIHDVGHDMARSIKNERATGDLAGQWLRSGAHRAEPTGSGSGPRAAPV